ncbi:alkaline phosphatase D [Pseudohyphozyma bogoriensis]|nr:alkaline phosphatase D [Pseudohyphozyma bogoriensis]
MGKALVRFVGGTSSLLFRFGAYVERRALIRSTFLNQQHPASRPRTTARPKLIPLFWAIAAFSHYLNNSYIYPSRPASASPLVDEPSSQDDSDAKPLLAPSTPNKPSYATVTAAHTPNEKLSQVDAVRAHATPNGNGTPRRKRNSRKASSQAHASALATAPSPSPATGGVSISGLLFGTPSSSPIINTISLIINTLLLVATLDSIWTPVLGMAESDLTFVRVGAVDHTSAKIIARIPPESTFIAPFNTTSEGLLAEDEGRAAKVAFRPTKPLGKWQYGPEIVVDEEKDWTGLVKLEGLYANTEYEYRLLLPSLSNAHHPAFPSIQSFTTFPDPSLSGPGSGTTHFTFAASSCVKPGFPYNGPGSHKEVYGAKHLLKEIENQGIKFMVFLGDLIYVDVPYYAGPHTSTYYKLYRQIISAPAMKAVFEKIPFVTIWCDDHEIFNDFSASTPQERYPPASKAYIDYFGAANPDSAIEDTHYYDFRHGDAAFFVMDARSYRSANHDVDEEGKTMLGAKQKEVFFDWLAEVNNTVTWKFVVSSTPMMSLWSMGDDTWAGFLAERDELLDVMEWVPNVIVLSGDRHEFAASSLRTTVTEFSTSPLSMFYLPIRTVSQNHSRGATGEDTLLKYLPDGNSKFSTFEVDNRVVNKPVVHVRVIIDGEEAWKVDVLGQPIKLPPPPMTVGHLGKSLAELLAFLKRSWF